MTKYFHITCKWVVALLAVLVLNGQLAKAQDLSVRNNLIYDASGTLNIGLEHPIAKQMSVGVNAGFKSWPRFLFWDTEYVNNTKHWKHFLVAPEFRYYLDQVYDGLYTGVNLIYTHYNVGNVRFPFGLYPDVATHRLQGDFFGAGIFVGYSWWISDHWRVEAEVGLGAGLAAYDRFECDHCGTRLGNESKPALVPKLVLNLAYNAQPRYEWVEVISQIDTIHLIRPLLLVAQVKDIAPESTAASSSAAKDHWITPLSNYRTVDEIINAPMDSIRYVHFPLNDITLYKDFADNSAVLDEILDASRRIIADERDSLALIQIVGLASVEGEWKHNKWLGEGRANALKQYVMQELDLEESQVEAQGRGEAWPWFRNQIAALVPDGGCGITGEQASKVLDIIDNEPDPEARERKLKADKKLYKAIQDSILHDQRNSGYVHIYYTSKPDAVAEGLNSINALIQDHRYADAVKLYESNPDYMARTKTDAEAANAYGIALFGAAVELETIDTEKVNKALEILRKAEKMGSDCARGNLEATDEFLSKYDEYMEQKLSHEARKAEAETKTTYKKKKDR
ncbi:MAG: DUF3575 domain-containing protein [Bacteroidales bacterium]|nr:DUF3575 domain-containing protein [Bacteroidales bacterium]